MVPVLDWQPCYGSFECAFASVPVDYDHPRGATVGLYLIKLPASDPAHRIGSLFVNPGGPGGSGVDAVRYDAQYLYPASVRARFDIIGFDPRGTGNSRPVRCYDSDDAENKVFSHAPFIPLGQEQQRREVQAYLRYDAACAKRNGSWLEHLSTANVARDLDLLRQAVGDRGLTYDGVSYGSFLGETYANMFPRRVRAMVIDGIVDPGAWVRPQRHEMAAGIWGRGGYAEASEDALRQFLKLCAASPSQCSFSAGSRPLTRKWAVLMARLKRHSVTIQGGGVVTYSNLVDYVSSSLYQPAYYGDLADVLQLVWQASSGRSPNGAAAGVPTPVSPPYNNSYDALFAISCVDSVNPRDPWYIARSAARSQRTVPDFGRDWAYLSLPCATWPARDLDRYAGPFDHETANPVLVVGNTHDAATSYSNAVKVSKLMPNARLLTLDGVGHTSWDDPSACVQDATAAYWIHGTLPPVGTVCEPDSQPFGGGRSADAGPSLRLLHAGVARL